MLAHLSHHLVTALPVPLLPFIRDEFALDYTRAGLVHYCGGEHAVASRHETAQSSPDTEGLSTKQLDLQKALATLYLFHLDSADF